MDHVRLFLEAKFLQWTIEGMPEIPLLLRQNENSHNKTSNLGQSRLLDLWRLWHQEIDVMSLEMNPKDILDLINEAESIEVEECDSDPTTTKREDDFQLNLELMGSVTFGLKVMQSQMLQKCINRGEQIDFEGLDRLERETLLFLSSSY